MSDHDDNEFEIDETASEAREWLLNEVRTRGARAAYKAAIEVCEDPKAPAPARATMVTALFRVGGYFATSKDDDADIEPHQMTAAQLNRAIAKLRKTKRHLSLDNGDADDSAAVNDGGVFN